ncbi:MAG: hypothetical protein U0670_01735 [Anaerolineae bacterium]
MIRRNVNIGTLGQHGHGKTMLTAAILKVLTRDGWDGRERL